MQVSLIVEVLQKLSVAGSITEESSDWLSNCVLSAKDVDHARKISLDAGLGEELWVSAESHAISLVCVKRCGAQKAFVKLITALALSQTCDTFGTANDG